MFVGRRSAGRAFGWALAVILCLGMLFGGDRDVRAQTKPAPPPAVLTAVESSNVSAGETKFVLTFAPGADVLPVFSPDYKKLMWTSTRDGMRASQLYIADFIKPED